MDPFINYLIKIGGIVTILALFAIFLSFRFTNIFTDVKWPPEEQKCPDYWSHSIDADGNGLCEDTNDLTGIGLPVVSIEEAEQSIWSTTCNKKTWADGYGLTWDGVTNTTQSCDTDLNDSYNNSTLYQILQKV